MRAAALDLGSNTLRLLVAEVAQGDWQALDRGLASPRLGRGLEPGGRLAPGAKAAARQAATRFVQRARALGAERIALAATQACRQAADGAEFVAELGRELELDSARVISGAEEAALSRRGVLSRLQDGGRDGGRDGGQDGGPSRGRNKGRGAWLADIGGGSTEVMDLGEPDAPVQSLPLGAVSLTEAHLHHDPPTAGELEALEAAVAKGLAPILGRSCRRLVATAGTAATLAALRLGMTVYEPEEINNLTVTRDQLAAEYHRLAALPLDQRRQVLTLEPDRADILVAGLAILKGLVTGLELDRFITMDAGLLEGILLEHAAQA